MKNHDQSGLSGNGALGVQTSAPIPTVTSLSDLRPTPILLDKIQLRQRFDPNWNGDARFISLDTPVSRFIHETGYIKKEPNGFIRNRKSGLVYSSNGRRLSMAELGIHLSKVRGGEKDQNEFSDAERAEVGDRLHAEHQNSLFARAIKEIYSTVVTEFGAVTLDGEPIAEQTEFYVEFPLRVTDDEAVNKVRLSVNRMFGAPKAHHVSEAGAKFGLMVEWKVPPGTRIKLYKKKFTYRLEVAIGRRPVVVLKDMAIGPESLDGLEHGFLAFYRGLLNEAAAILREILNSLETLPPKLNVGLFYEKLREFGIRSPQQDDRWKELARCLLENGVYTPSYVTKPLNLNTQRLRPLVPGLLRVLLPGRRKSFVPQYGWELAAPSPRAPRRPARAQELLSLWEAVKNLNEIVERFCGDRDHAKELKSAIQEPGGLKDQPEWRPSPRPQTYEEVVQESEGRRMQLIRRLNPSDSSLPENRGLRERADLRKREESSE